MYTPHKQPEGDGPQPLTRSDLIALVLKPLADHQKIESVERHKFKTELLSQLCSLNESVEIIAQGVGQLLRGEE